MTHDNRCLGCRVELDQIGDRSTVDCGGMCLKCCATAGDEKCIKAMDEFDPEWRQE